MKPIEGHQGQGDFPLKKPSVFFTVLLSADEQQKNTDRWCKFAQFSVHWSQTLNTGV